MNTDSVFEIHLQFNRGVVSLPGKTITDAFAKLGVKTKDGNIDFSLLDHYFVHQITVTPEKVELIEDQYQLILLKESGGKWEFTKSFSKIQDQLVNLAMWKKDREGYFRTAIIDVNTEKVVYWK
jgi:hypothetical protein